MSVLGFEALALGALIVFVIFRLLKARPPLPPGPKPWPIIGNMLDVPTVRPWERYREWCDKYDSDVIFIQLPTLPMVILGSVKAATDLLEKRSQLYSDRRESQMLKLMSFNNMLPSMPYDWNWRIHRRMFHQYFNQGTVDIFRPIQLQETRYFMARMLNSPEHTRNHIRHFITSTIFSATYGKTILKMDDDYVTVAHAANSGLVLATIPGAFWVESMPFLKYIPSWMPGAGFKKFAAKYAPFIEQTRTKAYDETKQANENGIPRPSVANTMIEEIRTRYGDSEEGRDQEEIAKDVTGIAYGAGADTTASAVESFLLAMDLFPEVQKRGQAELDRVVGSQRLPEYEDLDEMPYIRAIMMETMRWMPVTAFGVPHAVTTDDEYQGYHIPKGAMVVANQWAMLHNPEDYPEPDQFKPERFLDTDGNIDSSVRDPTTIAFGFGRRICVGRYFSHNTLFICIASILHAFNISAGVNAEGIPIKLVPEMTNGIVSKPKDVPTCLTPRSKAVAHLIEEAAMDLGLSA
ncbi:hypothetical protein EUX98_g3443 [Antrodiella citrinella]|uniref:Cytochrome P450 n=1 Tax=Antrodiella citrinella TaxID=2447956 RepID=A0A4S4MWJ8_9APHY|nr:hypothetical protein EUX98_g3443 [Antrodiella citrinella]